MTVPMTEEEKAKYANVKFRDGEVPASEAIADGKFYPKPLTISKVTTPGADFFLVE